MKRGAALIVLALMLAGLLPRPTFAAPEDIDPDELLSDAELTDAGAMSRDDIQTFLTTQGTLGHYLTMDLDGEIRSATDIIWNASQTYQINPQFLLVLLQREQSLVNDPFPTKDQFDWALGYGVCDDCAKTDPGIQKFRGFAAQVHFAADRIRTSYLADITNLGVTVSGVGPGHSSFIDNTVVIPANAATSVLYSYTPHLHGNENFARIWHGWFQHDYPNGTLLQDTETETVWLIEDGERRAITTRTAFLSRFRPESVIRVNHVALIRYDIGSPISYPNYSLLRSPSGTVYLIVDDARRGFASQEAFRQLGFSPEEIIDVSDEDLFAYREGVPITDASPQPQGKLLQDPKTGGVFYVEDAVKHPIMSREILGARFPNLPILPDNGASLAGYQTGDPVGFSDGTLIGVRGSPDVFVVSDGQRRLITDEKAFLGFGWHWGQIVWTNERSVLLHPLGLDVQIPDVPSELSTVEAANE